MVETSDFGSKYISRREAVKHTHEIRDPLHVFIRLDSDERRVVDSPPVQRLRHIQQLALTNLVYPGATHKRFEHSLGVMELAGRVFDVVTQKEAPDEVRKVLPELEERPKLEYWKRVLRVAALCHDIGHLPFSHAAEKELLPKEWDHERLTRELLTCPQMLKLWEEMTPPLRPVDIVKLAVGPRKAKDLKFSNWEAVLSEIIVGNSFGVDRIDYLLRDSHHAGVAYGRFDHYRLIDTLAILPAPTEEEGLREPMLGVEQGGVESAEALLIARYLMYSQVYFHPVRRIYDIHLKDFLTKWLPGGMFSTSIESHLAMTDNEVMSAIHEASNDSSKPSHDTAKLIMDRQHFKLLYQRNPADYSKNPACVTAVFRAAREKFGSEHIRMDDLPASSAAPPDFPVLMRDKRVASSLHLSDVLNHLPASKFAYVFVSREKMSEAHVWLDKHRDEIVGKPNEEDNDES